MTYKQIKIAYLLGKISAAEVWAYVPSDITEIQAASICGPKPNE